MLLSSLAIFAAEDVETIDFISRAVLIVFIILCVFIADRSLLPRNGELGAEKRAPRQAAMLVLTLLGLILIVLVLPVDPTTRSDLLQLIGLVVTAVIGLSSTTFVSNAMAGLMLRSVSSFRPGDFIRVGERFGRVTERGLFHTEIQTEDRDLTTLPNMYLVTNPTTVVHSSGTVVSATLSLGYDVHHSSVEPLFLAAATKIGLQDPFVQVLDLGDHTISYRVAGFLVEVKTMLTARSNLRRSLLDTLHEAGVEILSPNWMAQRPMDTAPVLPEDPVHRREEPIHKRAEAETKVFDKAEDAAAREALRDGLKNLQDDRATLIAERDSMKDADSKARFKERVATLDAEIEAAEARITQAEKDAAEG